MNNSEKIEALYLKFGGTVQVIRKKKLFGLIPYKVSEGWLWIDDNETRWSVILANGMYTHTRITPALMVRFDKITGERSATEGPFGLSGVYKTAITMHPVEKEEESLEIFNHLVEKIDLAYNFHFI